ncbi:structural protein [Salmonella phage SE_PL]|nr:structural protein [Salmonella phage 7t3]QIG63042.1 structural protein [Salmonella phage SE_PL]
MIPFSKILTYGNIAPEKMILDVDYSTQEIGSTGVPDRAGNQFLQRSQIGTINPVAGTVVYDDEIGSNVLDCTNSSAYFRTLNPVKGTKLDFSLYNAFDIEYRMKCSPIGGQTLFETGNYNSRRISGFVNAFNQYSSTYNQVFIDWGNNYARVLPTWANPNAWDTIKMEFRKGISITVHSELFNETQTFPWYQILSPVNQYFSLFGSYVDGDNNANPVLFKGRIQYIKMREVQI